jgi:muramoyltetrapeptide carboxypeptidase
MTTSHQVTGRVAEGAPIRPPALRRGGRVALISPAWCGPHELPIAYSRALAALERSGYQPVPMPHATDSWKSWIAAPAELRAADLNQAFADTTIDAILCTIGGNHSAQMLPYLDFDTIARNPKPFCGYSDITALHHGIQSATRLVTFYGPALIPQWGIVGGPLPYTIRHFELVVGASEAPGPIPTSIEEVADLDFERSERNAEPLRRCPAASRQLLRPGHGAGPLLVACLPSARGVLGTPWQPTYRARVLVLDIPTAPYSAADADADFTHMRHAGCFDELAALVLCRTRGLSPHEEAALFDIAMEQTAGGHYPVIARFEGGHSDPMPTWPIGVWAEVCDVNVTLAEPAVSALQSTGKA